MPQKLLFSLILKSSSFIGLILVKREKHCFFGANKREAFLHDLIFAAHLKGCLLFWSVGICKYSHSSLSAGLLFAFLTIRGPWIVHQNLRTLCTLKWKKWHEKGIYKAKQWSLVICSFGIFGIFLGHKPCK